MYFGNFIFNFSFLLFCFNFTFAQSQTEIDKAIRQAQNLSYEEKNEAAYQAYLKIIEESKKVKYSKGLTEAYLDISRCLFSMSRLDESTRFLLLAKNEKYARSNAEMMSKIYFSLALNVHATDLYEEALKYYKISISYAEKMENPKLRNERISTNYLNTGDVYELKEKYDSALYYYHKSYELSDKLITKMVSCISLVDVYVAENQIDSAGKYIEIGRGYAQKTESSTYLAIFNRVEGNYNIARGNYEEAIRNFKNSERMEIEIKRLSPNIYKMQADAFAKWGKKDSAEFYIQKYLKSSDIDNKTNKFIRINNSKVPLIISSEEKKELRNSHQLIIIIVIVSSLIIMAFAAFLIVRQRKKIAEKSVETKTLKRQLNSAFEEVIELAKNNSPQFLPRFIEVYPEFYAKLLEIQPELTHTDLLMAAYLKLNFSTKETADYTFSSIRTIQNRKYRLRKKLNLDQETDILLWIQNL